MSAEYATRPVETARLAGLGPVISGEAAPSCWAQAGPACRDGGAMEQRLSRGPI